MQPIYILSLAINIVVIAVFIKLAKLDPIYVWLLVIALVDLVVALIGNGIVRM